MPDGSIWVGNSTPAYDTEDYARDMTDRVALVYPIRCILEIMIPWELEPKAGDEIAIYAIGLGAGSQASGL